MKSENIKTLAGLAIILLIVVATFLYGNAQRQAQKKVVVVVSPQATASATPVVPNGQISATTTPATAPVVSPSANTIQGSQQGQTSSLATQSSTPVPSPTAAIKPANPTTSASATTTTIPDTGSGEVAIVALAALATGFVYLRISQRRLLTAVRSR